MSTEPGTRDQLYVDVSCVRIQSYLSRTPRLRGHRGASAALAAATRYARGHSPVPNARINAEAGEADGVISLVREAPPADRVDREAATLARQVFRGLRERLPAAEFQAVWAVGPSYLEAHHHGLGPRLQRGDVLVDLPTGAELPYASVCTLCHIDPAWKPLRLVEEEEHTVCADCHMRFSSDTRQDARTAEYELAEALGTTERVRGLSELAALGSPETDRNHVGTVFIDGNAFGQFFERIATAGHRLSFAVKAKISGELNEHTRTALTEAVRAVQRDGDGGRLCAVPFLVGGDDVLVSLPADRAWVFTRRYLETFGQLAERTRQEAPLPDLPALSASAGLVFSHATEPFSDVVEAADGRLSAAKSLVCGTAASVDFTDLTAGHSGGAVRLEQLEQYAPQLQALAALPPSARATLAALPHRSTGADATTLVEAQALRQGHQDIVAPFLAESTPIQLRTALEIARWWQ